MSSLDQQRENALEWLRDVFDTDVTKLLLSTLIICSVLPFEWVQRNSMFFFGLFAIELALRLFVLRHELRHRRINRAEIVVLGLDLIAVLSFLPLESLFRFDPHTTRFLRLFRLTRMLMLLSYWRGVVREVWRILIKRERRYQLIFVASVVVILTFTSAIFLTYFTNLGVDFNEDGKVTNETFWTVLWWSFRQVQDPGNLMRGPEPRLAFIFSVCLTLSGVFVFAFVIGIGASVVEELVTVGRERRLGMRRHSVIGNISRHSRVLVEELINYYEKSFRSPRLVTIGEAERRYDFMHHERLRSIRYRSGRLLAGHDLVKVDADRAARVILLGDEEHPHSDSEVISQILSVREVNADCWIQAELQHRSNVSAAIAAGGARTVPIVSRRLVSLLLSDLIVFPDLEGIYDQLLSSSGDEIYTAVYGMGQLTSETPPSARLPSFSEMLVRCHRAHGVLLLGYLVADDASPSGFRHVLNPRGAGYPDVPPVDKLRGFFGVASNFERIKAFSLDIPDTAAKPADEVPEIPRFAFRAPERRLLNILVCGYNDGLVELCRQVLLFCPQVTIFLLAPDETRTADLRRLLLESSDPETEQDESSALRFVREGPRHLRAVVGGKPATGGVRMLVGNCADDRYLGRPQDGGYRLDALDAVLLSYTDGDDDPDARTALALLKLLAMRSAGRLKPNVHLLCAVQSSEKAELLERRYGPRAAARGEHATVVGTERLRNSFLAQGVFVPGIAEIYDEMLSCAGHEVRQLKPVEQLGDELLDYGELLAGLYRRDGQILIAVELTDADGASRVVLNPKRRSEDYRFAGSRLRSIFTISDGESRPATGAVRQEQEKTEEPK